MDALGLEEFHLVVHLATVPHGLHYYWRSHYLDDLGDRAIDTLVDHAWDHASPWSYTILFQLGGAVRRLPDEATAFSGGDAGYALNINAVATDGNSYPEQDWPERPRSELREILRDAVFPAGPRLAGWRTGSGRSSR